MLQVAGFVAGFSMTPRICRKCPSPDRPQYSQQDRTHCFVGLNSCPYEFLHILVQHTFLFSRAKASSMSGTFTVYTCTGRFELDPPSYPQSSHSLRHTSTATSCASSIVRDVRGRVTTPYDTAIQGMWSVWSEGVDAEGPGTGTERAPARAAPRVPEDRAKAVEEFRPSMEGQLWRSVAVRTLRLGPEMTRSISPG